MLHLIGIVCSLVLFSKCNNDAFVFFCFVLPPKTLKGDIRRFQYLWEESIAAAASDSLKLVAVSFPDLGSNMGLTLAAMNAIMGLDGASAKAVGKSEATHSGGGSGQSGVDVETVGGAGQALNVWQVRAVTRPWQSVLSSGCVSVMIHGNILDQEMRVLSMRVGFTSR